MSFLVLFLRFNVNVKRACQIETICRISFSGYKPICRRDIQTDRVRCISAGPSNNAGEGVLLCRATYMQSRLLRSGVQHRNASRQHLSQQLPVWSSRDSRLHRLHTDGEPETDGTSMDRMRGSNRLLHIQLSLHSNDLAQSVY